MMDLSLLSADTKIIQVVMCPLRVSNADGSPCTVMAEDVN